MNETRPIQGNAKSRSRSNKAPAAGAVKSKRNGNSNGKSGRAGRGGFDPLLMAVLSSRLEAIIREMSNTVMKASRSAVIKNARDMSCGLLTYDHRLICVEEAMPIHVSALDLTTRPITELFDDVREGDAFFNNSPYLGVTHHADMTLCVPVFIDGEPLFWTLSRSHHADVGAPEPSTYLPYAAEVYQEGVHFPCVRVQRDYKDIADVIRIGLHKIRVPKIWYGDFKAQVGACRIGERRLQELARRYGTEVIREFVEQWMEYGKRRAIAAIRKLKPGTYTYSTAHDPVPGVAPSGVPITAKVEVDPKAAMITVDLRDNPDCVPGGINLSEATATGSCLIGVFYNLDPFIPHNAGSASRVRVLLRDGCVVGRPTFPAGTSVATTNVNDRLINAVQCCFAQMGEPFGLAEGGGDFSAGLGVISGVETRKDRPFPYVNQLCVGLSGGPALHGHDGWLTYEAPNGGGVLVLDSIEIDESMYPVLLEERRVGKDSMGCGRWNGAPATVGAYRSLSGEMSVAFCSDGDTNTAKGVLGGDPAAPSGNWRRTANGELEQLPSFHIATLKPGEAMVYRSCAGGGYGDPRLRDPDRVARDVNREWLSPERAESVFAVALKRAPNGIDYVVDEARTAELRRIDAGLK
jgi:N-methylhydantoinase B